MRLSLAHQRRCHSPGGSALGRHRRGADRHLRGGCGSARRGAGPGGTRPPEPGGEARRDADDHLWQRPRHGHRGIRPRQRYHQDRAGQEPRAAHPGHTDGTAQRAGPECGDHHHSQPPDRGHKSLPAVSIPGQGALLLRGFGEDRADPRRLHRHGLSVLRRGPGHHERGADLHPGRDGA